jgi:uncharacterized protein YegJ (DUF2314 family)
MRMRDERRKEIIEIWKIVVEVQQHFNDIGMRIRSMFVTILLALFASIGFLLDKKLGLNFGVVEVRFSTIIPIFGIIGTLLFYFIDRYWYHRLLVGSVKHAIEIEKKYKDIMPELSLSEAIGAESPYKPGRFVSMLAKLIVRHQKFHQTGQLHSDGKLEFFYKSVILMLVLIMMVLALAGGVTIHNPRPSPSKPITASLKNPPGGGHSASNSSDEPTPTHVPHMDPAMTAAFVRAAAGLDMFFKTWRNPPPGAERFAVKIGLIESPAPPGYAVVRPNNGGEAIVEWLWLNNLHADGADLSGRLADDPEAIHAVSLGQVIHFTKEDIGDWMYRQNGKIIGNATACAALAHASSEERQQVKDHYGIACD